MGWHRTNKSPYSFCHLILCCVLLILKAAGSHSNLWELGGWGHHRNGSRISHAPTRELSWVSRDTPKAWLVVAGAMAAMMETREKCFQGSA